MAQHSENWDHCLQHAAVSDVGLRRANNQDSMAVATAGNQQSWEQRGHLFLVADGMGAHAAGELASKLATDAISLAYSKLTDLPPPEAIRTAIEEANDHIHQRGQADIEFRGMGTTCTSLLLLPQGALAANVGDSRTYRLRGDRFEQLTFDHSLVWEMRAAGQVEDETIANIPSNIITRSLGPNPTVQVDVEGPFPIAVGDTFLLCSDGLSGPVDDDEMGVLLGCMPPDESVRALVDLANLRGGPDNITAIVVRVTAPQVARANEPPSDITSPRRELRPVHPLLWTALGVFALATAGAAWMSSIPVVLGCLAGTLTVGVVALMRRYGGATDDPFDRRPLGKGPYTACTCPPNDDFVARFTDVVGELRDAATGENWTVDWQKFDAIVAQAVAARQAGNARQAIRECFQAIAFVMAQLKHQGRS